MFPRAQALHLRIRQGTPEYQTLPSYSNMRRLAVWQTPSTEGSTAHLGEVRGRSVYGACLKHSSRRSHSGNLTRSTIHMHCHTIRSALSRNMKSLMAYRRQPYGNRYHQHPHIPALIVTLDGFVLQGQASDRVEHLQGHGVADPDRRYCTVKGGVRIVPVTYSAVRPKLTRPKYWAGRPFHPVSVTCQSPNGIPSR